MKKLVPPGTKWKRDIIIYVILLIAVAGFSTTFLKNNIRIGEKYKVKIAKDVFREEIFYHDFGEEFSDLFHLLFADRNNYPLRAQEAPYFRHTFLGSTLFLLYCIIIIIRNYYLMNNGAKSMYLLERLPKKNDGHIRCTFLPIVAMVADVMVTAALMAAYYNLMNNLENGMFYFDILEALL